MFWVIVEDVIVKPFGRVHVFRTSEKSFATFTDASIEAQEASRRFGTAFVVHRCSCGHVEIPDIRRSMLVRCSHCMTFSTI